MKVTVFSGKIVLSLLLFGLMASGLEAAVIKIKLPGKTVKLKPGDSAIYLPINYKITFRGFRKQTSKCAMPGENCGGKYFPEMRVEPELNLEVDDKCKAYPLPAECEFTYKVASHEKESYIELAIVSVFDSCEQETDVSNKTSCFIRVIKNGPSSPPYRPANCERLAKYPEARDTCYETVADKLQDPKICDFIKGQEMFQCVYLRAKSKGDPEVCKTLQRNRYHHTESAYRDEVAACLNTVKRK